MEMTSISASTNGLQQQLPTRQPQEVERPRQQPEPQQRADSATSSLPPQASGSQERPERVERVAATQPVVNAQGQKTGSIINTTA